MVAVTSIVLATVTACASIAMAQSDGDKQRAANPPANAGIEKTPKTTDPKDANPPKNSSDAPLTAKSAQSSMPESKSYTSPISVSGRAFDADGKPLSGATIYISSQRPGWKRVAETKTDETGKYQFTDTALPIERANTNTGHDSGAFIVYGQAKGHGFAWRPWKGYYPQRNGNTSFPNADSDLPMVYMANDKIELDLHFAKSARIAGKVVNSRGEPIAKTKLSIWGCERVPQDGYGPQVAGSSRRPFAETDLNEFELLNAGGPPEMQVRSTDADGRFEFSDVPAGCRFSINVQPPGYPTRMIFASTRVGLDSDYDGRHLYDAAKEIDLTFRIPRNVPIQVVYGDSGANAAKVFVSAGNEEGTTWKTSDDNGQVTLSLPAGQYELHATPVLATPYLETESKIEVKEGATAGDIVATLRPAAQVEVHVVDEVTGKGIPGVDLWSKARGLEYYATSWEAATHIVHRDRQRTDENGIINALFEPGKQRLGVAWQSYPKDYESGAPDGKEIECESGKKTKVTFQLRKVSKE